MVTHLVSIILFTIPYRLDLPLPAEENCLDIMRIPKQDVRSVYKLNVGKNNVYLKRKNVAYTVAFYLKLKIIIIYLLFSLCQVWHWCLPNGRQFSFLCPNGTVFSQTARVCDWWFKVNF